MPKRPNTKRRQRRHGDLPAGFKWREGRPRWEPSPSLRAAGWKGSDLKGADGAWLALGPAVDRAGAIAEAVGLWRASAPLEAAYAWFAPAGACEAAPAVTADRFAIGALVDAFLTSDKFAALKPGTQRDYTSKLKRLVDALAGYTVLPAADAEPAEVARYTRAIAQVRAFSIFSLRPVETDAGIEDPLKGVYRAMAQDVGKHAAAGTLTGASLWLDWCRKEKSRRIENWAKDVQRETPPGRIRPLTWEEAKALITTADAMGLHSIADSIVLGIDLSWSQIDRLKLTWNRVLESRCVTGTDGRTKTGRVGGTPLTSFGKARLTVIKARQEEMAAKPTHVLWCELTGAPWQSSHYRHKFAEVRARAAKDCPSLVDGKLGAVQDADLRDTAFSWARAAGLNDDETASRTLQSRRHVAQLGDAHYGEIGPEIADAARDKYEAYLTLKGVRL